jgi:hypothetical protein
MTKEMGSRRALPWVIAAATLIWGFGASAYSYRALSFNLHGYHPMGELPRYFEDRDGKLKPADSNLFFFKYAELARGHKARLDLLAAELQALKPDLVFLQEIGAGEARSPKTCELFESSRGVAEDAFSANSALRLTARTTRLGLPYTPLLSCRGNTGWVTDPNTFQDTRIVRVDAKGRRETVFDFGENPYPHGLIVEGLALLVSPRFRVLESGSWKLPIRGTNETFHVQFAALAPDSGKGWILAANVHGGHKLRHFEQAIALRHALLDYARDRAHFGRYQGPVVGGDFNARLWRPGLARSEGDAGEIATLPWELKVDGFFDARAELPRLEASLDAYNRDKKNKEWATITDPTEARGRIRTAVDGLRALLDRGARPWTDSLWESNRSGACKQWRDELASITEPACSRSTLIDHILVEDSAQVERSVVLYPKNNWQRLDTLSDHPAVMAEFNF